MKLRPKILIISTTTLLASIVLLSFISRLILLNGFEQVEQRSVTSNLHRVLNTIDDQLTAMGRMNADWAYWDQTADFIRDHNPDYVEGNLSIGTFKNLHVNVMMYFDMSHTVVFSRTVDLDSEVEIPLPDGLDRYLMADSPFFHSDTNPESLIAGVILLDDVPMLVTSRAILDDAHKLPVGGTLLLGRFLDPEEVAAIGHGLALSLTVERVTNPQLPPDFQIAGNTLTTSASGLFVQPLSENRIAGYAITRNISGDPILFWRVDMPRDIYAQGNLSINYFLVALLVVGLIFTLLCVFFLEYFVLSRLAHLHRSVSAIRQSGNLHDRLPVTGHDELTGLADAINGMLRELDVAQTSLQQTLQFKSDILANVSHDARSPLSTIQLRAEMLQLGMYGPLNEQQNRLVESILTSSHQLLFFVNNLLDASRLESGKAHLNRREFNLAGLLHDVTISMTPLAEKKGLRFSTRIAPDVVPTMYGDPERLVQILSNLIGNAIKFTDQGEVRMSLCQPDPDHLRIDVSDTGPGISPEEQAHIFEAFYQVDRSITRQQMQGVGLGLAIVIQLVNLMEGSTSVQSEPGAGSTFTINLPLGHARDE